jgi:glycosyltransferase involved in cell wall biosynthesis
VITVAITTFNRGDIISRALRSALAFVKPARGKVVLIDDASEDHTETVIRRDFGKELSDCTLTYSRLNRNLGVTGAKNAAFALSQPGWVIFLDSDDELILESASAAIRVLAEHAGESLVFFRCVDQNGILVGRAFSEPQRLTLSRYAAHTSYGEALIAINKNVAPEPPFDADLYGYEGLGCARLIKQHGPALLSTVIARRYDRTRNDRLSSFIGIFRRAEHLARGHLRYVSLYNRDMKATTRIAFLIKVLVYFPAGLLARMLWSRYGKSR